MKGIILNLLTDVVSTQHGEDHWDDLLDDTGLVGAYTSLGNYSDAEMMLLVDAHATAMEVGRDDVLRGFGRAAIPALAQRYSIFFDPHRDTRSFLRTINNIIHAEVRKLYPGANPPDFDLADLPDGSFRMTYRSARRMCALAEGFIQGTADHFGERLELAQPACMHRGDDRCELVLRTSPA